MATIQEIAKRAGTSVATVSHVINRTRFVSDELRGRVERAMEELGAPKQERGKITVGFLHEKPIHFQQSAELHLSERKNPAPYVLFVSIP